MRGPASPFLRIRPIGVALFYAALLQGSSGCKSTTTTSSTTTSTVAPGSGNGYSFANDDFFMNVVPGTGTTMVMHVDGDWTKPCSATVTTTGQDIACILEVEELDLYDQGLTLQYNASSAQCPYVRFTPYMYYVSEPGLGDTDVQITVTNGAGALTSASGGTNVTTSLVGTTPTCNRDYSKNIPAGPNCCEGTYLLTTVTNPAGTTTYSTGDWGGKVANCLAGPAVDTQPKDRENRPMADLTNLKGSTLNTQYVVASPRSKSNLSNIYAANYFTAPYTVANAPIPIQGPVGISSGIPWYQLECLDHSEDVVNRIRLMVRSWSTHSNFAAQVEANSGVGGAETSPFTDSFFYDHQTWVGSNPFVTYPGQSQ